MSREILIEAFEVYGEIFIVKLVKNGRQVIVGLFYDENADKAIESLEGRPFYGTYLMVTRVGVHRRSRRYHQGEVVVHLIYVKFDLI